MATIILGDIVEVIKETVHNPQESGFQYFVGLEHYDSGEPLITRYATPDNLTSSVKHFAKGDILVARRNVYLKRASLVDFEGVTSGDSIVLRAKDKKYQQILPFILNSDDFWDYAEQNSDGTMSKRLSPADLLDYEFEEPENIELLADKLWAAYRVKESYKKLIAATDDMLKAKFIEMFVGKTQTVPLYDVADITTGSTPSRFNTEYWGGNNLWVSAQDMWSKYIWDTIEKVSESGYAKCKKIPAGSILYVCRGSIGLMAINKRECATNQSICTATCNEKCLSEYLYYYLEYSKEKTQKTGVGTSFKALNQSTFASIKIELPPLPLQQQFVEIATQAEATKESLRKSIENIDQVIKSLINQ